MSSKLPTLGEKDLHAYQHRIANFIMDKKVCALWVDMGLGKTISTLTAIDRLIHSLEVRRVLVVAPLAVTKFVWKQEAKNWTHTKDLRITIVTGALKERERALSNVHDVLVINRENLPWLITHYKNKMPFDMLVIDESSSFKSHSSQRFKRLRKVVGQFRYVVELTATPAPDKLMGLWSQMYLLDFGISLGRTWTEFVKTYFNMSPQGFGMTLKPDAPAKMYKKIVDSDMVLQLSADDYLKMPTIVYDECKVDMDEKVYAKYKEILKSGVLTLDETKPATAAMTAAALLTKLLQYSNGAVYDQVDDSIDTDNHTKTWTHVHDAKLDMLESLIDSIDEPVIVAYSFKHDLERIQKRIKGVSTIKDPGIVEKWNKGEVPVLVLHPACLHPETEVLTEFRGWVKIVDIKRDERVFDGIEFVSHKGCSYSGVKPVIQVAGVTLTPNHKILVDDKWVEAKYVQNDTDFRRKARYIYSGNDAYLGEMLQLPKGKCYYEAEFRQGFQVSEEPKVSDVYDLVDCGPRNRFVIRNKEGDVFISHNSAGHGLNLQAGGSRIIWFGLSYNLEYWQQLNGRLYRQGQTKPVIITTLICRDTVESRVHEALKHKDELQSNLLNILRS